MTSQLFADDFRGRLLRICLEILTPLAKCLIRCEVSYAEFSELSKMAFVNAASESLSESKRDVGDSRISELTGLRRKEVREIRANSAEFHRSGVSRSPGADLLHAWYTNKKFIDERGEPRVLPFSSDSAPCFSELVDLATEGKRASSVRTELKKVGAIAENGDGTLYPLRRHFVPIAAQEKLLISFSQNLKALVRTIAFNTTKRPDLPGRIERFVYTDVLPKHLVEDIRPIVRQRVEAFTESVDDELTCLSSSASISDAKRETTIGVGVFYFEEEEQ